LQQNGVEKRNILFFNLKKTVKLACRQKADKGPHSDVQPKRKDS
jgi:hypothetical protein